MNKCIKKYLIYNLIISLLFSFIFFVNELLFYGSLINFCINIILSSLLVLQFIFSLYYIIYHIIKGVKYSKGAIILVIIVLTAVGVQGLFILNGGVWNTDTGTIREYYSGQLNACERNFPVDCLPL